MFDPATPGLKRRLAGGRLGLTWFSLGTPALVELAVRAGAEAVAIDLQHGLFDRAGLEAVVGACPPSVPCLARVEDDTDTAIFRALDAGVEGIIVPLVESGAQAAGAAAACHYPPRGRRSAGGVRPLADFGRYRAGCDAAIAVGVMVETAAGVERAAEIAAAPLVDFVFIGSGDLGLAVAGDAEALEAACARVLAACRDAGKPCGIFTPGLAEAQRRHDQGYAIVVPCADILAAQAAFAAAAAGWRGAPARS